MHTNGISKRAGIILLLFVISIVSMHAGTTGKIGGTVKDEETGEVIIGATIIIKGTPRGAATDANGEFFITNIPPGTYTVEFSLIGYNKVAVNNVRVLIDQTTTVDASLKKTSVEMQTVVVNAERPMIQPTVTNKATSISSEDIQNLPVISAQEILNLQTTVVQVHGAFNKIPGFEDRGIDQTHVRGGRNGEIAYMVDGMYVEDAIYAGMGTFVNRGAIEEMKVEVGGFNAEYGEAQSSVVNIVTKEGGTQVHATIDASTSGWADLDGTGGYAPISKSNALRDFHSVMTTLSAPIPFLSDLSIFASAEQSFRRAAVYEFDDIIYDSTLITDPSNRYFGDRIGDTLTTVSAGRMRYAHPYDTYTGWQAFGFNKTWDANIKLTYKPTPLIKINALYRATEKKFRSYNNTYRYATNGQHIVTDLTDQQGLIFRHQPTNTTFYTVNLNRFWKTRTFRIPGLADDELGPGLHPQDYDRDGRGAPVDPKELWHWDPTHPDYPNWSGTGNYADPLKIIGYDSTRHVYLYSGGTTQYWTNNFQQSFTAKADLTSQITRQHELKVGVEFKQLDVFFQELQYPYSETPYAENYLHHPKEGSIYVQDQMDFSRLIVNAGGRIDWSSSGGTMWSNPKDPTTGLSTAPAKTQFSPRLGFGYRITEAATFHFNYGHFFQVPEYRNLYTGSTIDLTTARPLLGNPQLAAQKTISYEFGLKYQLGEFWAVDLMLWTKSLTGQTGSINIQGFDPDSLGAYNYYIFDNYDHGTARGLDVSIEKRFSDNFGGNVDYTYSVAKANRYYSWTGYWNSETAETEAKRELLMPYDQTHNFKAIIYFRLDKDFGPEVYGLRPFQNWFLNFIYNFQSGIPYTPVVGSRDGDPMSARMPSRQWVDATIRREFDLMSGVTLGIYARIRNLFDTKNALNVYAATGSPTEPDPTSSGYSTYYDRPDYFDTRREIDFGARIEF